MRGGFKQDVLVDTMIRVAQNEYHPDWIINSDADEFWYSENLKKVLSTCRKNVIRCQWKNMYPDDNNWVYSKYVVNRRTPNITELSPYSIYTDDILSHKVMHRSKGYLMIHQGNHDVSMRRYARTNTNEIVIYHYCTRGIDHFYRKYYYGAKAIYNAYNESNNIAVHWKYYYKRFIEDGASVEDEYDKHIGRKYFNAFVREGLLKQDTVVHDILSTMTIYKNDDE